MSNELKIPLLDKKVNFTVLDSGDRTNKIYAQSYRSCKTRINLPTSLHRQSISSSSQLSNFTLPITTSDIILTLVIILLSSMQFGIFTTISDKASQTVLGQKHTVNDFIVLCWKWQFYLIVIIIFGAFSDLIHNRISDENLNSSRAINNITFQSYQSCVNYFISSSSLSDIIRCISFDSICSAVLSVISTYCLFHSSRILSFATCAMINSLTSLIPFYTQNEISERTFFILKLLSPLYILSGMMVSNYSMMNVMTMTLCLVSIFGCQVINQNTLSNKMKTCSPFQILLSTYVNFFIVSTVFLLLLNLSYINENYLTVLFGWMFIDKSLLLSCVIGFGVIGAVYSGLGVFASLILKGKSVIRNIKYFDIICNDIFGIAIFGKNIYDLSVVYVVGILQSILGMFILDFYPGLMKYAEMKGEEIKKKN